MENNHFSRRVKYTGQSASGTAENDPTKPTVAIYMGIRKKHSPVVRRTDYRSVSIPSNAGPTTHGFCMFGLWKLLALFGAF